MTNNAYLAEINGPYVTRIGYDGDNNLAVVTGNSTFTNSVGVAVGYNDGVAAMKGNSLLIATGGKVSASYVNIGYNIVSGTANNSNSVVVSGATSVLNTPALTVGLLGFSGGYNNAVVTGNALSISNGATIYASSLAISAFGGIVGSSTNNIVSNNYVTVNSGSLYATTKLTIGNGSNEQGYVSILNGGLLEANIISNNTAVAGSYVTNNGGIYQFTTATPTLVPNGAGNIALNNGWISFRAVTNVNVTGNWSGPLTNLTFSGANTFRLNAATNTAVANQTYVVDPGLGATNYAGLEMINGATRYRGQAGNSLTIGQSVGSGGSMLCSNTAAVVELLFTNNGTLTLFNSTLTLATNATFNGALHIDANHLLSLNATLLASNLTLGAGSSLVVTGAGTNATLITYTTLSGGFGSITSPAGYGISVANGQVSLVRSVGTCCFFH